MIKVWLKFLCFDKIMIEVSLFRQCLSYPCITCASDITYIHLVSSTTIPTPSPTSVQSAAGSSAHSSASSIFTSPSPTTLAKGTLMMLLHSILLTGWVISIFGFSLNIETLMQEFGKRTQVIKLITRRSRSLVKTEHETGLDDVRYTLHSTTRLPWGFSFSTTDSKKYMWW